MAEQSPPRVLTIAGSDSGGGAGLQADLKTFAALGVYGTVAVTSVTAQNTQGVFGVHDTPPDLVAQQIDAVIDDIGIDAVKSGMLSKAPIIEAVADRLRYHEIASYVLDPVMISETGHALLQPQAIDALKSQLIPLSFILTPNIAEAEALTNTTIEDEEDMRDAARAIQAMGATNVLVKGGHMKGETATDVLCDADGTFHAFSAPRIDTRNTHGTGCTYASAIAAYLAKGDDVHEAVSRAKDYVTGAIKHGLDLGQGAGPLGHFWNMHSKG